MRRRLQTLSCREHLALQPSAPHIVGRMLAAALVLLLPARALPTRMCSFQHCSDGLRARCGFIWWVRLISCTRFVAVHHWIAELPGGVRRFPDCGGRQASPVLRSAILSACGPPPPRIAPAPSVHHLRGASSQYNFGALQSTRHRPRHMCCATIALTSVIELRLHMCIVCMCVRRRSPRALGCLSRRPWSPPPSQPRASRGYRCCSAAMARCGR